MAFNFYPPPQPLTQEERAFLRLLATAIIVEIRHLQQRGGPSPTRSQAITRLSQPARMEGEEETTSFKRIAEALAVLSFLPGGIDAAGLHCQADRTPPVILLFETLSNPNVDLM